ncbi:hypothetical protein HUJ04_007200 [Dendroctonus ponderosae]|nr:hypothetical protein HUJ04_007200 [Dendroctonus ponderosae]
MNSTMGKGGLIGVTASLNPNGVGLESNPAFLMARPQCDLKTTITHPDTKVILSQESGKCHTTMVNS